MDIRARSLLSKIKEFKGAEHSVIAGGAVRDTNLEIEPKDYDFYIPSEAYKNVVKILSIGSNAKKADGSYPGTSIKSVYNMDYEGIKVQLMAVNLKNDEELGLNVVKTFDYGLCMAWYEGSTIIQDTEEYQKDKTEETLTLYKLEGMSYLPMAMERFNYLNKKLGGYYSFRSPLLEFKGKEKINPYASKKMKTRILDAGLGAWDGGVNFVPAPPQEDWNDRIQFDPNGILGIGNPVGEVVFDRVPPADGNAWLRGALDRLAPAVPPVAQRIAIPGQWVEDNNGLPARFERAIEQMGNELNREDVLRNIGNFINNNV